MTSKPILADMARAEKIAAVAAELADLVAAGVKVVVTPEDLVDLEAKGLVVDPTTGEAVAPLFALDR